jgi:hypothetical protein
LDTSDLESVRRARKFAVVLARPGEGERESVRRGSVSEGGAEKDEGESVT